MKRRVDGGVMGVERVRIGDSALSGDFFVSGLFLLEKRFVPSLLIA